MKILIVPTTEGFGHISRAKAITEECERYGLDYTVFTDEQCAQFLEKNSISYHRIDSTFYGLSYVWNQCSSNRRLNIPLTTGKLLFDTPRYFIDWGKVFHKLYRQQYDILINDINLQLSRFPFRKVINIMHYKLPAIHDLSMIWRNPYAVFYEGFVEPIINVPYLGSQKFIMDLRADYIDYDNVFPPIVARITQSKYHIRNELHVKNIYKLIVDGRTKPPIKLYQQIVEQYPDITFLVRTKVSNNNQIISKPFIPGLINYINVADLFITHPGFASLSEGAICGTPMLIANPENHFEQMKNMWIATIEGYGTQINTLETNILEGIHSGKKHPRLQNGLKYLIQNIIQIAA